MKPSVANYEDPMPVDLVYRQDKCISGEDFHLDELDYIDLNDLHGGNFSCLQACQAFSSTMSLAFINSKNCICAPYNSLPPILRGFRIIQP